MSDKRDLALIAAILSMLVGIAVLNVFGAPRTLAALIESMLHRFGRRAEMDRAVT